MTTNITRTRAQPILQTVGKRQVISTGRWNDLVIADYIMQHGGSRRIEISELAKIAYGHNNKDTKTKVRRYLHKIRAMLIDRGALLVVNYEPPYNRAVAVWLNSGSPEDHEHLDQTFEKMKLRGELSIERFERAMLLLSTQSLPTPAQ